MGVIKHGYLCGDPTTKALYKRWMGIMGRCSNPKYKHFHRYGGRGIRVCEEWRCFETFKGWALATGFSPKLTIDRIDNDGDYHPSNCRWVTNGVNAGKRGNNLKFPNGKTTAEIAQSLGVGVSTIQERIRRGIPVELAMVTPKIRSGYGSKTFRKKNGIPSPAHSMG